MSAKVAVYGGLKVSIDDVHVELGSRELDLKGKGKLWGRQIEIDKDKDNEQGSDDLEFEIEVPADATVGEPLVLHCDVAGTVAQRGLGRLRNQFTEELLDRSLEVPILIRSPGDATLWRWLKVGQAVVLFVLACLGFRWLLVTFAYWNAWADEASRSQAGNVNVRRVVDRLEVAAARLVAMLGGLSLMAWAVIWGYVGYLVFALPLVAATAWTSGCFCGLLILLWVVGPYFALFTFPSPQQKAPQGDSLPASEVKGKEDPLLKQDSTPAQP